MSFKELHPDYENYSNDSVSYQSLSSQFYNAFHGLIIAAAEDNEFATSKIKQACNIIAKRIPTSPTTNSGRGWLDQDLKNFLIELKRKPLPKILDVISEVVKELDVDIDALNEVFTEENFGFRLRTDYLEGMYWDKIQGTESLVETISEALVEVKGEHVNVLEHLEQAKKHATQLETARPRKDALRDAISALEAQLKYYTGARKLEDAVTTIQQSSPVPRAIIRDARTIWDRIHSENPDARHGSQITSDLSEAEALYWIDRIMALIKYLSRELE